MNRYASNVSGILDRYFKCVLVIAFFLMTYANIILFDTPTIQGYEASIYSSPSGPFWLIIVTVLIIGILGIVYQAFRYSKAQFELCILLILLVYSLILYLPIIRGYFFAFDANWDALYHIGETKWIISQGNLEPDDWYPVGHMLLACMVWIGIPLKFGVIFLTALFSQLYILFMYTLSTAISKSRTEQMLFFVFSLPLLFADYHRVFMPSYSSLLFFPIILYALHEYQVTQKKKFALILLMTSILVVFFHPLTAIIMLLILSSIYLSVNILGKSETNNKQKGHQYIILILIVIFLFWLFNFFRFGHFAGESIEKLLNILISQSSSPTSVLDQQIEIVNKSDASLKLILDRIYKYYGPMLIYFALGFISSIYTIYMIKRRKIENFSKIYMIQYILGIIYFLLLMSGLITGELYRAAQYALIITPIFCGITLIHLWRNISLVRKFQTMLVLSLIICNVAILGIFIIYPSPWYSQANSMITLQESEGIEWYFTYGNLDDYLMPNYVEMRTWPIYYFAQGYNSPKLNTLGFKVPSHFGYNNASFLGELIKYDSLYMFTDGKMRQYYLAVPEDRRYRVPQYLSDDFQRLHGDPTVAKLFSTSEFEIWKVN